MYVFARHFSDFAGSKTVGIEVIAIPVKGTRDNLKFRVK